MLISNPYSSFNELILNIDTDMNTNSKRMSKFKTKYALNEDTYMERIIQKYIFKYKYFMIQNTN